MTDDNMLDLICQRFAGHPAADLTWPEMLRVRDAVERLLDGEVNRRQRSDLPAAGLPRSAAGSTTGVNVTRAPDVATGRTGIEGSERTTPGRLDLPAPQSPGSRFEHDGAGDRAHPTDLRRGPTDV